MVRAHADDAYNLARWILRNPTDAEDAVQDAAIRAYRSFWRVRGDDTRPWFLAIVRNCAINRLRRLAGAREVPLDSVSEMATPSDVEEEVFRRRDAAEIQEALYRLPVEQREVVVLREMSGYGYEEIARILSIPSGTVMSRLSRGRRRLIQLLAEEAV